MGKSSQTSATPRQRGISGASSARWCTLEYEVRCVCVRTVVLLQGQRVRALHVKEWVSSNKCLHGLLLSTFTWIHCRAQKEELTCKKLFLAGKLNKAPQHVTPILYWSNYKENINYTLILFYFLTCTKSHLSIYVPQWSVSLASTPAFWKGTSVWRGS